MTNDPQRVAVINESSRLSDGEIAQHIEAVQAQMDRDVGPMWNFKVSLNQVPKGEPRPTNEWWMVYADNADVADALGYHELTPAGLPIGKVFVETTLLYGNSVSRVLSHETAEMMVDPYLRRLVSAGGRQYIVEVGDPLSLDQQGYFMDGSNVRVSGIAYPDYFYGSGTNYDKNGHLQGVIPKAIEGTYLMWLENNQWHHQMFATGTEEHQTMVKAAHRPHVGSRRYRRLVGEEHWLRSNVRSNQGVPGGSPGMLASVAGARMRSLPADSGGIEIELSNGTRLRVDSGFDERTLASVVRALGQ
jgi:hypothetical protein